MKKHDRNKKTILLLVLIAVISILCIGLFYVMDQNRSDDLKKVYASFKCNCCETNLLDSDELCAVGLKEEIKAYQKQGLNRQELFDETVKLLGVMNIYDVDLKEKLAKEYRADPPEDRAILELSEYYVNLGNVSESEDAFVMKEFMIKNTGEKDLLIYGIETSCSCLETKFIIGDKESPTMGRFSFPYGMTIRIEPGDKVRMRATYDARVNSFFRGHEIRWIYIYSNDLVHPSTQIKVEVIHSD